MQTERVIDLRTHERAASTAVVTPRMRPDRSVDMFQPRTQAAPLGRSILQSAMATTSDLIDLRGVSHVSIIDVETGAVMTKQERPRVAAKAEPRFSVWVQSVTKIFAARTMTVEDVMFTTADTHHLLKPVPEWGALGSWIYLTLDRESGNVAIARRALAACGSQEESGGGTWSRPRPTPAVPRRLVSVPSLPSAPSSPETAPRATWTTARPVEAPPAPAAAPAREPDTGSRTSGSGTWGGWWTLRRRRVAIG